MSALNSILLEGVTVGPARTVTDEGSVHFQLRSDDDVFVVRVPGKYKKLGEAVLRTLMSQQRLQVAGRLAKFENGTVTGVLADHVEFRHRLDIDDEVDDDEVEK